MATCDCSEYLGGSQHMSCETVCAMGAGCTFSGSVKPGHRGHAVFVQTDATIASVKADIELEGFFQITYATIVEIFTAGPGQGILDLWISQVHIERVVFVGPTFLCFDHSGHIEIPGGRIPGTKRTMASPLLIYHVKRYAFG